MAQILEKIKTKTTEHLFYNKELVQNKFKLPTKTKDFKHTFFSSLRETVLLNYYCLRDKRFRQISSVVFKLLKQYKKDKINIPTYLRDALFELGSTFIKIGQFLSSRTDLLAKEYIDTLSDLQDSVPPLPFKDIQTIIESEFKKPISSMFRVIESKPIASASIGQVHKAELLNGIQVVIKVQRPNLQSIFYQDLAILRCLATFFERNTQIGKEREWVDIIDEIGKTLFEEIDFIEEGRNADRFRRNLKHEEKIYIPKIFWQCTSRKVLTIEFVPGIKITDVNLLREKKLNPKEIAFTLVNAYFKQFFEDGFYHADPHPGNLVVRDDGVIVFYDFGMVGRLSDNIKSELANILISAMTNDTDTLVQTMNKLNLFKNDTDTAPIKRIIEQAAYKYYNGTKLNELNTEEIEGDLKLLFDKKPMKLPSKFTYTLRATGALEGICRTLDPQFSLMNNVRPYFESLVKNELGEPNLDIIKNMFPEQIKLIEKLNNKIKIYLEVLQELPRYVSESEIKNSKTKTETIQPKHITNLEQENELLQKEISTLNSKLNSSYSIIFLICLVFIGSFLIEKEGPFISFLGFVLLGSSLIGSIAIVWVSIFNKKMIE